MWRPVLERLFSKLDHKNIPYCVLRNYENLPDDPGHNLSMAVGEQDWQAVANILGDDPNLKLQRINRRHKFYSSFWKHGTQTLEVDMWSGFHWRSFEHASFDLVMNTRKKHGDIWVADSGVAAAISLIKALFSLGDLRRKPERLAHIRDGAKSDLFREALKPYFSLRDLDWVQALAQSERWDELARRSSKLRRRNMVRAVTNHPVKQLKRTLVYSARLASARAGVSDFAINK